MYVPEHFAANDAEEMAALMRAYPFACLVSSGGRGLYATHLPTVYKVEDGAAVIECHLARANPHWKDLAEGGEAVMIFSGPQAYVSPNWYPSKAIDHKAVPTWNYAAVHAYGRPHIVADGAWLLRHVGELSDRQEAGEPRPWSLGDAPEAYVQVMLRGIVGFRFEISRLEGKWKMSQNRPADDRAGVIAGLEARGHGNHMAVAAEVRARMIPRG